MKGIISAIAFNLASPTMYALGTFDGSVNIFDRKSFNNDPVIKLEGSKLKGVTQLKFAKNQYLLAGGRVDGKVSEFLLPLISTKLLLHELVGQG